MNEIRKNDIFTIEITDLSEQGDGIGHTQEGYTLFVKDTLPGDRARVKVIKTKKNYGYARLEQLLTASPSRCEARCAVARSCGGCRLQHMRYADQLSFKENRVRELMTRIGGADDFEFLPIIGMENPWHYRNKAQYPVGVSRDGRVIAGFYAARTHSIVENDDCLIQMPQSVAVLRAVMSWMQRFHVTAYDEKTGRGLVRHVLTRIGYYTGEIMVCFVINGKKIPHAQELIDALTQMDGMTGIVLNSNTRRTNVILGDTETLLWGRSRITDTIGDIRYEISAKSFYQVNPQQTEKLYRTAMEFADLKGTETVWDLYCGIGTISLSAARHARQVIGVEIVPQAVEDARRNALLNGIENAAFYEGKAEEVLPEKVEKEHVRADVIIVDPPRKGCAQSLLACMAKMAPEKIVYVSCNPATLARDAAYLRENGYRVEKVRCCDMFAQTTGVETVCLLSQRKPDTTIEVDLDISELEVSSAETKATYEEIKSYVLKKFGLKVSNLYIAQVKRECGIVERINYNLPKTEGNRVPQCPEDKRKAIKDAFIHFQMI
jgi:23S rRNA (uracil1939-C5)-methyltransferase